MSFYTLIIKAEWVQKPLNIRKNRFFVSPFMLISLNLMTKLGIWLNPRTKLPVLSLPRKKLKTQIPTVQD